VYSYYCNPICSSCTGNLISNCNGCFSPYFLQGTTCQLTCNSGFYQNTIDRVCYACFSTCSTCNSSGNNACFTCQASNYFYLPTNSCYTICPSAPLALWGLSGSPFTCITTCPSGYYYYQPAGLRQCLACSGLCLQCVNLQTNCSSCSAFYTYNSSSDLGSCSAACPSYTYQADPAVKVCEFCSPLCLTCNGPLSSNCLTCNAPLYLQSGSCVASCSSGKFKILKAGYYLQTPQNICSICVSPCQTCNSSTYCLSCIFGYMF
jgi:proprotein convertase subtilisin/kexin type 5